MAVSLLTQFGSTEFYKYGQYEPGTYKVSLRVDGNAILSNLFVSAIDLNTTITVQYYEDVRGIRRNLQRHEKTDTGTQSIIVGPQINVPFVEATVSGGNATFAVIGTARTDQPVNLLTYGSLATQSEFTDDTAFGVKTIEMGPLVRADYDEIEAEEIDSTTENFTYKLQGTTVATLQFKFRSDGSFESVKRL